MGRATSLKVRDWMITSVITVTPDISVLKAFSLMKSKGLQHLPVVRGECLVGIVSDRDLRRPQIADVFQEWNQLYRISDDIHVEDVMVSPVLTVTPETDLIEAAKLIAEKNVGALPVIQDSGQKLVGIICTRDVLRALVSQFSDYRSVH